MLLLQQDQTRCWIVGLTRVQHLQQNRHVVVAVAAANVPRVLQCGMHLCERGGVKRDSPPPRDFRCWRLLDRRRRLRLSISCDCFGLVFDGG